MLLELLEWTNRKNKVSSFLDGTENESKLGIALLFEYGVAGFQFLGFSLMAIESWVDEEKQFLIRLFIILSFIFQV